jgi:glycine betaine/choline ABC-type transport system substrate-binding protein
MDDGGKLDYNKNSKNQSVVLNTQSFTEEEVLQMVKELSIKFNLNCEIRSNKGKKIIVISAESFPTFKQIIEPYIHPKMAYKLPK